MLRLVVIAGLVVAGAIHLLPLIGVFGADRIARLYDVALRGPDIEILMRHRAVLFGMLGAFLLFAALKPAWRTLAFVAGFASVLSFLAIAYAVGGYNASIARVVTADFVALAALAAGAIAHAVSLRRA